MTKREFLTQLQRKLNAGIGSKEAAEFVEYYQEYIEIELRKGNSLEEIMERLGDPGLIARSIIDVHTRAERSKSNKLLKYGKLVKNLCTDLGQGAFEKFRRWFNSI